jgi:hypothetical protein
VKADIITLQDPSNAEHTTLRDVNNFKHLKTLQSESTLAKESEGKVGGCHVEQKSHFLLSVTQVILPCRLHTGAADPWNGGHHEGDREEAARGRGGGREEKGVFYGRSL